MKTVEETVAQAMDCRNPEILPYLPYILQDFWEIGSSARIIADIIVKDYEICGESEILDLGCGKGAVSITLAKNLGGRCLGIDAISEFIDFARDKAIRDGVGDLCRFICGDARQLLVDLGVFDIIILASVGQILGPYQESLRLLRKHLKPGGLILLDDGYIEDKSSSSHPQVLGRKKLFDQIRQAGLTVRREYRHNSEESSGQHDEEYEWIVRRCGELGERYPEKKELFDGYVDIQRQEYAVLENDLVCAAFVLEPSSSSSD